MNQTPPDPAVRYRHLLAPIKLGPMTLPHRAIMSAHSMALGDGSGKVSRRYHRYLVERAKGGAALVGMESAPIHETSRNNVLDIRLFDDAVIPSLARLADQVHKHGAKLSITLWHGGHNVGFFDGTPAVSASQIPSLSRETPRALTRADIREIVKGYGTAAARCLRAGLDAVELQTATGYLVGSFLSSALNHRDDEYGGNAKNRVRIVTEILETIRDAVGDQIAVGGLEASRQCGLRGYSVDLYEAGAELGGQMLLAARSPHRAEMLPAIAWWSDELKRLGVQIHLGHAVDNASTLRADHVLWAVGSAASQTAVLRLRPFLVQGIPGSQGLLHGRAIMSGAGRAAGAVAVINEEGGWAAVSLAETLAATAGVESVTVLTTEFRLGESQLEHTRELASVTERLGRAAIRIEGGAVVEAVEGGHLSLRGGQRLGPYDQIILSTGSASNPFPDGAPALGDCLAPRGFWAATTDAVRIARAL